MTGPVEQGKAARAEGRIDAAIAFYGEAAEQARRAGDAATLAHHLRHIGDMHREEGRTDAAVACYDEALAFYRSLADPPALDLANLLRPMAILAEERGETGVAAAAWAEANALYACAGVEAGMRESARRLARLENSDSH